MIAGPNGAGKTTFLRMVSTELSPSKGTLSVLGYDVLESPMPIKRAIGVMPQEASPYGQLTVWEHISFFTRLKGLSKKEASVETEKALKLLDLEDRRNEEVDTLSGGLRRRVILAQAITNNPKLLLLDEPTAGFDPAARKRVWEIIIDFQRKKETTVILTTPYLDDARAVAQGIVIFNKGKVITQGSVEEVMSNIGYEVEIELENRKEISDIMNAHGIEKIKIDGDRIIAWITWKDLQKIVGSMTSLGLSASNMKISRPSLDEVYLDILRRV